MDITLKIGTRSETVQVQEANLQGILTPNEVSDRRGGGPAGAERAHRYAPAAGHRAPRREDCHHHQRYYPPHAHMEGDARPAGRAV